ncbi:plasmid mobilization relaxosome protein MobC [Corynebacterium stationis]|uniref:plasmid mobilization relaxosome protein MobC n=1 Tax=Corynebacterium stationis TaxID=1705 RepID=UPI00273AD01F|nr:plasmid mobilization relaxosome protein MobC [Corynebacterium stationis]WLP86163.1 plasmid mobilization relaxosome protein MobC [Corynebacterium stationis]
MTKQNLDAWQFTCRLNADRADYVRALADRMELPAAEVVRLALDVLTERVPPSLFDELRELPPETRKELARLTQEVNRIGVNVNQLVRAANAVTAELMIDGYDPDPSEIEKALTGVNDELVKLRRRVSDACR